MTRNSIRNSESPKLYSKRPADSMLAIAASPPRLSFDYNELNRRVHVTCLGETPQPQSVYQSLQQMAKMAESMFPSERVLEYDGHDLLDIVDPYFLYYLRWSGRLGKMGAA